MAGLTISSILGIGGSIVSAIGTIAAGQAQAQAANYQAAQLDLKAKEERASAQREGFEIGRQKGLVQSRIQALSAASGADAGGGAFGSTIDALANDVEAGGTYRELMANYGGEERAKGLRAQATGARLSGQAAATGSFFSAAGTILGGASTFFDQYGWGRPTQTSRNPWLAQFS